MENEKKSKAKTAVFIIDIVCIALIVGLILFLVINYWDDLKKLTSDEGKEVLENFIKDAGVWGILALIAMQIFQVIVAFIPGEVVELVSGVMYGAFFGTLICIIGLILGTIAIFGLVKLLGKPFVDMFVKEKDKSRLSFLDDPVRALVILFFLFLIPGLPKDILIYPIPFTKIKMRDFLIVSTIARIPSILSSTLVGSAIVDQNYTFAIIMFGGMGLLAILGLVFNKKIYLFIDRKFIKKKVEVETK